MKETRDSKYIYQKELDKVCFQHGMAYDYFKFFSGRTASDKVLRDKAFEKARNPVYNALTYIDKLDKMVDKYNNTYHNTITMKTTDIQSGMYIEYGVEHNVKDPKYCIGDDVRI